MVGLVPIISATVGGVVLHRKVVQAPRVAKPIQCCIEVEDDRLNSDSLCNTVFQNPAFKRGGLV